MQFLCAAHFPGARILRFQNGEVEPPARLQTCDLCAARHVCVGWQRVARYGTERQRAATFVTSSRAGNAGNCWQRWKLLATLEIAGNAGNCWQRWKLLATLEIAGNAGNCWQRWKKIG